MGADQGGRWDENSDVARVYTARGGGGDGAMHNASRMLA
jgi:hypothetical protein